MRTIFISILTAITLAALPAKAAVFEGAITGTAFVDSSFYGVTAGEVITLEFTYDDTASPGPGIFGSVFPLISSTLNGSAFGFDMIEVANNAFGADTILLFDGSGPISNAVQLFYDEDRFTGSLLSSLPLIDGVLPDQTIFSGFLDDTDTISSIDSVSIQPQAVIPLPATAWLMLAGLAGLGWVGRQARPFP
ncbi:MAG: VPLPA-CTERM sorting domain-containing protein [Pseudomonadota bacterium]